MVMHLVDPSLGSVHVGDSLRVITITASVQNKTSRRHASAQEGFYLAFLVVGCLVD